MHERAFGRPDEARLVDALRAAGAFELSLVAELAGRVVGHVLFTPARAESGVEGLGLAPLAVLPEHQRSGIGSALTREALRELRARGAPFVVVLGDPRYYARFGFRPASELGLRCKWPVPEGAFQALVLDAALAPGAAGLVSYRPEFDGLG